ncbi:MAG: nucleoside triphosphate pyrophosphatase [Gammaproteobacteria bacterium]
MPTLCLASESPRRATLLRQAGYDFQTLAPQIDESNKLGETPQDLVTRLSAAKAWASKQAAGPAGVQAAVFLGADTVVVLNNQVLGKPKNREDAVSMLLRLSGSTHEVITAVTVDSQHRQVTRVVRSRVTFCSIPRSVVETYCQGDEPLDKAGGYAIQGQAAIFVERLEGSYSAVMGLPLYETSELLKGEDVYPQWTGPAVRV